MLNVCPSADSLNNDCSIKRFVLVDVCGTAKCENYAKCENC